MDPQINLDGAMFHKPCAKCADCNCQITISNFTKSEVEGATLLLCKTHYFKRFKEGGAYVGGEKFQVKNARDVQASSRRASLESGSLPTVTTTTTDTTTASTDAENDANATSVRDRIASLKMTEKPVSPEKAPAPGRRPSQTSPLSTSTTTDSNTPPPPLPEPVADYPPSFHETQPPAEPVVEPTTTTTTEPIPTGPEFVVVDEIPPPEEYIPEEVIVEEPANVIVEENNNAEQGGETEGV
jgi:hypothetical protein